MANKDYIENLLLLFDRPNEPIFMSKGVDDGETYIDVPRNFIDFNYRDNCEELQSRFGQEGTVRKRVTVKDISIPDMPNVMNIGKQEQFSLFLDKYVSGATQLIDTLLNTKSIEDLQSIATYARENVNPSLFNYAFSVALLHHEELKNGISLPSLVKIFPDKFINSHDIERIRREAIIMKSGNRRTINIPPSTASDKDIEHKLWYFREDVGINLHHWHWHLVYPHGGEVAGENARRIVDKDRRGELFYYMHQQILARYDFERLGNKLARVVPIENFKNPLKEGYFPKLYSNVASRPYPGREDDDILQDVHRSADDNNSIDATIEQLENWVKAINGAINEGFAVDAEGNRIQLDNEKGIDILGNVLEASILSPNRNIYGSLHNTGHAIISAIHDPEYKHLEPLGVMGDTATAVRDPIFYRWHSFINGFFQLHKLRLDPYLTTELTFADIVIEKLEITVNGSTGKNILYTYWQQSTVNISRGLDFTPRGSDVLARLTHLNHKPFNISLEVINNTGRSAVGTVRVFLAPFEDENGKKFTFDEQRSLFIEIDKFPIDLKSSPELNRINIKSTDSNVTIPHETIFNNQYNDNDSAFCGCGWPHHMLIPKGNESGMKCELFVMISDNSKDKVRLGDVACSEALAYCGLRGEMYPDRKPMGYPFDRKPRPDVTDLDSFLTPNMKTQKVTIFFEDPDNNNF